MAHLPRSNVLVGVGITLLLAMLLGQSCGSPAYFAMSDAQSVTKLLDDKLHDGSVGGSLKDTLLAVETLSNLGTTLDSSKKSQVLKFAKEALKTDSIESIYYSTSLVNTLQSPQAATDKLTKTISSALESSKFYDLVYSIGSYANLQKGNFVGDITLDQLEEAVATLVDLFDEEYGTWYMDSGKEEGSPYLSGLALSALSQALPFLDDSSQKSIQEIISEIDVIFEAANEDEDKNTLFFRHTSSSNKDNEVNSLKATAVVVKGLADLVEATKEKISGIDAKIELLANFLLSQKHVSTVEDAHSLISGLTAINSGAFKKLLVLSVENTIIHVNKKDKESDLRLTVTDIWGKFAVPSRIFLTKAYLSGKEDLALLSNQEVPLVGSSKNVFSLDILAARPDPGAYILEFRVTPQEKQAEYQSITSTSRRIQVVADVVLGDGYVSVTDPNGFAGSKITLEQGKGVGKLDVKENNQIVVGFRLKNAVSGRAVYAHQVFLKFEAKGKNNGVGYFVIPVAGQAYEIKLPLSKVAAVFNSQSGTYTVQLIIGDSYISKSFKWDIATVNVTFESAPAVTQSTTQYFGPKPVIEHKFRASAPSASDLFTFTFSILVVLPLAFLIIGLLRSGANLSNYPTKGLTPIYALIFISSVGLLFSVIILYWLQLQLFTALKVGSVIGLPIFYFGHKVLQHYAKERESKAK